MNIKTGRSLLFSVTANDCDWSYTRGTGNGGQKKNKTSSAVHCMHRASNSHGYSEASRSQLDNRKEAFRKMTESPEFQKWLHIETMKRNGEMAQLEHQVEQDLKKIKIEIRIDGRWTEVNPNDLVDNPDNKE